MGTGVGCKVGVFVGAFVGNSVLHVLHTFSHALVCDRIKCIGDDGSALRSLTAVTAALAALIVTEEAVLVAPRLGTHCTLDVQAPLADDAVHGAGDWATGLLLIEACARRVSGTGGHCDGAVLGGGGATRDRARGRANGPGRVHVVASANHGVASSGLERAIARSASVR